MQTSIQFINHASIIVSDGETYVLSDPWYTGDAFHKGWNLLHETSMQEITGMLDTITHIWISHEHPDHFSISFYKTYADKIKSNAIKILFQKTKDKRVSNFLSAQGFDVQELHFNKKTSLSNTFRVTCIKDGFYDSGLLIEANDEKILNLNDCEVTTDDRVDEVFAITGKVDVLLTQFSFAAWKGGKENKRWRDEAAEEKINTMRLQIRKFSPKVVIPFASFIYFSNVENFYLNDAVNKPNDIIEKLGNDSQNIIIMAPFDKLGENGLSATEDALAFWERKYAKIKPVNKYEINQLAQLRESFDQYCRRIHDNNNIILIRFLRALSPIRAFKPCIVHLKDLDVTLRFDYVKKSLQETCEKPQVLMQSESLNFIFKNSFGFDTLTVNGCFEEVAKNGFISASKTLAIENLNNLGVKLELRTLFDFPIIMLFLRRLHRVKQRLGSIGQS